MSSLIQKMFRKALSLDALYKKIDAIEKRIVDLEGIADERESLWLFIEEMKAQEQKAYQMLQEELSDAIIRSIEPRGEA